MKTEHKTLLYTLIIGLLSVILVLLCIVVVFFVRSFSLNGETDKITESIVINSDVVGTFAKSNNVSETLVEEDTELHESDDFEEVFYSNNESEVLIDDACYIVSDTPASAGLVMRSLATSSSEKLGVLPEGTKVIVLSDDNSNHTGYVRVVALVEPMDRYCYVMKTYLKFDSLYAINSSSDEECMYVSYNTPEHLGLNMRESPYSSSDLVCLINEGTRVSITEPYNDKNNGYIKVSYSHPSAGENFVGWLLYDYLVY